MSLVRALLAPEVRPNVPPTIRWRITRAPRLNRLLKKSLSYGFEHSVVAEVERDLNLEGAVVTEFG